VEYLQAVAKKQTTEAKPKRSDAIRNIGMSKEVFGQGSHGTEKQTKNGAKEEQTRKEVKDLQVVVVEKQTKNGAEEEQTKKEVKDLQVVVVEKQTKNGAEEEQTKKEVKDLQVVVVEAKKDAENLQARLDLKTLGNIEVSKKVIGQGSHGTFVFAGYFKPLNKEIEK